MIDGYSFIDVLIVKVPKKDKKMKLLVKQTSLQTWNFCYL